MSHFIIPDLSPDHPLSLQTSPPSSPICEHPLAQQDIWEAFSLYPPSDDLDGSDDDEDEEDEDEDEEYMFVGDVWRLAMVAAMVASLDEDETVEALRCLSSAMDDMAQAFKQERHARAAAKLEAANAARKAQEQEQKAALKEAVTFLEGLVDRGVLTADQSGAIICAATEAGGPWLSLQAAARWGGASGDSIVRALARKYAPELPSPEPEPGSGGSGFQAHSTPYGGGSYGHTGGGNGRTRLGFC
ncbi:hypothetical protein L198_02147 [Cryptococcus wingfieldii CBS 7118]|uniref:Uncharacterized protein n=1 Tax=Cryptococcus wingfieldii CBS 7118 TaxID=1295528 RepID=A0A1E3JX62_9TREE|nr:hypothetical protein L198_02147 [Cryptococcus wingfieldii CBS 7118]ODO05454.1 hypothetical protein L198_02147 [Cryptococcus wingfieldii CBS 7118]